MSTPQIGDVRQAPKPQRGHLRSASLENGNILLSRHLSGLPTIHPAFNSGTLKSKNEQKRLRSKFGSHSNLEDYSGQSKLKFQNIRKMFEMRSEGDINRDHQMHQNHIQSVQDFSEILNIVEGHKVECRNHEVKTPANLTPNNNFIKPIAFKPIPFEPDYSIPERHVNYNDRYGSTPSLAPNSGQNHKFGSTSDLRIGNTTYSAQMMGRRHCTRSSKVHDSMESVRHTPDSDSNSHSSAIKNLSKQMQNAFDMTPSPSDSGVSDLEAALKDRDSELAYLRQTMEHNEKAIFKVHKDKEAYWENETKRLKSYIDNQQKEYTIKIKKLEQMLTLQSFQFRQNKLRISEDTSKIKEQFDDLNNENDILRNEVNGLRTADVMLKDRVRQLEEKTLVMEKLISNLKRQLEENEWTVCQKNGEIAFLKTLVKEAKAEINVKEQQIIHMKAESPDHQRQISHTDVLDSSLEYEISQLRKILIFKDQVIIAMTNELTKLRKELSDLSIFHEYGEEPSGKLTRLKYKVENYAENISGNQKPRQIEEKENFSVDEKLSTANSDELTAIWSTLSLTNRLPVLETTTTKPSYLELTNEIKNNLPDVTLNHQRLADSGEKIPENEDTAPPSDTRDPNLLRNLKDELEMVKKTLERERLQWSQEKEKVISYQKQLQRALLMN